MRKLPLILLLLVSASAMAQIRMGGGTADPKGRYVAYGSTDVEIQAAIDSIPGCVSTGCFGDAGYVLMGNISNGYILARPILVNKPGMVLEGLGKKNATVLRNNNTWYGPLVMVYPANYPAIALQSSLATGSGSAMTLNGGSGYWINLRTSPIADLNGRSAFTVEGFYKPTLDTTTNFSAYNLFSSSGKLSQSATTAVACDLFQYVNNRVRARLKVGSTLHDLSTADNILTVGAVHHIALTYNGTTIRLFVNGVVVASEAATGTITQQPWEDVTIGASIADFPAQTTGSMATGAIDSVRLSSTARYTAGFTPPTAKFTTDSSTLALINFDEFYGPFVVAKSGTSMKAYLFYHYNGAIGAGAVIGHVQLRNFHVESNDSGGIWMTSASFSTLEKLYVNNTRYGVWLFDNCFGSSVRDVGINASSAAAGSSLLLTSAAGLITVDNVSITGGAFPYFHTTGSGLINNLQIAPNQYTVYGMVFRGFSANSAFSLNFPSVDDETGDIPGGRPILGNMLVDNVNSFVVTGGAIEMNAANVTVPNVVVDGGSQLQFNNVTLIDVSSSPNFTFLSNPTSRVLLNKIYRLNLTPAISAAMAQVRVTPDLTGSVTISDTATEGAVSFAAAENDATYTVQFTAEPSASAVVGQPYLKPGSKTASGFTVKLTTAPTAGNTMTVNWAVQR